MLINTVFMGCSRTTQFQKEHKVIDGFQKRLHKSLPENTRKKQAKKSEIKDKQST